MVVSWETACDNAGMSEEDIFLLEILARPDDDAPRLIYADWLEDHDDQRAELIRQGWFQRGHPPRSASRRSFAGQRADACLEHDWVEYDDLVLTWEQFLLVFRVRLAETIAFCAGRELPLRTWDLEPRNLISYARGIGWPYAVDIDWASIFVQLGIVRRRLLERTGRLPTRPASNLLGGRLILFDPTASLGEQSSWTFSNGYFDRDNLPPWDTWIMLIPESSPVPRNDLRRVAPSYLTAWVPRIYQQRAEAGIEVNEEGCLELLHRANTPFARRLRDAHLLGVQTIP